jgi:hypothetical protein
MKSQAIWAVLVALTIWLTANTAKTNTINENAGNNTRLNSHLMDRIVSLEEGCCKEEEIQEEIVPEVSPEVLSFNELFGAMRMLHGPDNTFVWNGREYTTNYHEETIN